MTSCDVESRTGPGRPPDPGLEARVHTATLDVYGEVGWAKFSLDLVARRARVGKAALYARWGSKEKLIVDALTALHETPRAWEHSDSLRADLVRMAQGMIDSYFDRQGLAILRAQVEAKIYPELFGLALEDLQRERIRIGRAIVLRGIERGELPPDTSPALVLDAIAGIVTNHVLSPPADRLPSLRERKEQHARNVVDFVLSAVGHLDPSPETPSPQMLLR